MIIFFMRHKDRVTVWNIQYATAETLTFLITSSLAAFTLYRLVVSSFKKKVKAVKEVIIICIIYFLSRNAK